MKTSLTIPAARNAGDMADRYFLYSDDTEAQQKELEIVDSLAEDGLFDDLAFPADASSLYKVSVTEYMAWLWRFFR